MEKQWEEKLRKRFADRQMTAPEGLWNGIEAAMKSHDAAAKEANVGKKNRRTKIVTLWKASVAVAVACAVVALVVLNVGEKNENIASKGATHSGTLAQKEVEVGVKTADVNLPKASRFSANVRRVARNNTANVSVITADEADTTQRIAYENIVAEVAETAKKETEITRNDGQKQTNDNEKTPRQSGDLGFDDASLLASTVTKSGGRGVSFSVYGSNFMSLGGSSVGGGGAYMSSDVMHDAVFSDPLMVESPIQSDRNSAADVSKITKTKHHQPVHFGVTMRIGLTPRLALSTGVSYSYLSSNTTIGDGYNGGETEQRLHYIGVPLNIVGDLWRTGGLNVYATAGGAIDVCVSGRSKSWWNTDNTMVKTEESRIREHRPQLSVNAAVGVQYDIVKRIGVFAEPGVGYYFNNHSGVNTIYKDKPFCFNLSVGLRFNIE